MKTEAFFTGVRINIRSRSLTAFFPGAIKLESSSRIGILHLPSTPSKETAQNTISHQARAQRRPSSAKLCLEVEDSLNLKRLPAYERTIVSQNQFHRRARGLSVANYGDPVSRLIPIRH